MIAHLYINRSSFKPLPQDTVVSVGRKLLAFHELLQHLKPFGDENRVYLNKNHFGDTPLLPTGISVMDAIDWSRSQEIFGTGDIAIVLQSIFSSHACNVTDEDCIEYLTLEDEENCHGILVMNRSMEYQEMQQVISNIPGWWYFRRYYLAKYPKDTDFFQQECVKYFPSLILSVPQHNLRQVFETHIQQIVHYLAVLNDHLLPDWADFREDWPSFLKWLSSKYHLDGASMEGAKDSKFYFLFTLDETKTCKRYCESHLKMFADDAHHPNRHCRIYFSKPQPGDHWVFIGHIGQHL